MLPLETLSFRFWFEMMTPRLISSHQSYQEPIPFPGIALQMINRPYSGPFDMLHVVVEVCAAPIGRTLCASSVFSLWWCEHFRRSIRLRRLRLSPFFRRLYFTVSLLTTRMTTLDKWRMLLLAFSHVTCTRDPLVAGSELPRSCRNHSLLHTQQYCHRFAHFRRRLVSFLTPPARLFLNAHYRKQ